MLDAEICNVGTPEGNWGAFVLLESGGHAPDVATAAESLVRYEREVQLEPAWIEQYQRMQTVFDQLYVQS